MPNTTGLSSAFRFNDRYLLAEADGGGVVVDLASGNYFRVNRTAALVCRFLRDGERPTEKLAGSLGISAEDAQRAVEDVISELASPPMRDAPQGTFRFLPIKDGYALHHDDRCVLNLRVPDQTVRLATHFSASVAALEAYLRAVAPKILFQNGITVLHASACRIGESAIAFAGLSGAGKTTTALAFSSAGAELISEDLVILDPATSSPTVMLGGERVVRDWARAAASRLRAQELASVSTEPLLESASGAILPLRRVLFLDSGKRLGRDFVTKPMNELDTFLTLMRHSFLGGIEPDTWRRFCSTTFQLARSVDAADATAPEGIDQLVGSAARYISNLTS